MSTQPDTSVSYESMRSPPAVSVVVPTHNRPVLLLETLDSLRSQTLADWEAVVVDDGSDPPVDFALLRNRYGAQVHGVRHERARGLAAARNSGATASTAPIITFLDDDDLFATDCLQKAMAVLGRYPDVDVVFLGLSWFGTGADWANQVAARALQKTIAHAKGLTVEPGSVRFDRDLFAALLQSVPNAFQHPVVRREAFARIGVFEEGCFLCDCDWAIRAALRAECMLMEGRFYLARTSGQGYFSRADRKYDQLRSGVEIMDRLLNEALRSSDDTIIEPLREAAASAWFSLAYHHSVNGELRRALSAWRTSQARKHQLRRYRFLARLAYGAVLGRPPRPWEDD